MRTVTHPSSIASYRLHALRVLPALLWMGVIFLLSAQEKVPTPPGLDLDLTSILGHFSVYAVLAALLWWALGPYGLALRPRVALTLGISLLYALSDEWHQSFVPGRYPDAFDVLVDVVGAVAGIAMTAWLTHRNRRAA